MICIENEHLKAWIKPKGAELKSLVNKHNKIEHIWDANPFYWAKSSPALFPIVGALKDGIFNFKGKTYYMERHGFARDQVFEVESKTKESVTFVLHDSDVSLKMFPFAFKLALHYSLNENVLSLKYEVINTGENEMYFSLGAHPAFQVPFDSQGGYNQYVLEFNRDSNLCRWLINNDGLLTGEKRDMELNGNQLALSRELFDEDALVMKDLKSNVITLKTTQSDNYLKFNFEGFSYFGIWAAKKAPFVCLEPWCGIADSTEHNHDLTKKEGINKLEVGSVFERSWSVEVG